MLKLFPARIIYNISKRLHLGVNPTLSQPGPSGSGTSTFNCLDMIIRLLFSKYFNDNWQVILFILSVIEIHDVWVKPINCIKMLRLICLRQEITSC